MLKIAHRVNTIEGLKQIVPEYGVEVDIRADGDRLILNHEPFVGGEDFGEYLESYEHAFIILNIKESGIEDRVIKLMIQKGIEDYFLLDVEFPYIFQAIQKNVKKVAVRYSEAEPIEQTLVLKDKVDWVWIDTNTKFPIDEKVKEQLQGFKTCLVSPDRWGRPEDIEVYKNKIKDLDFKLDAVMVGKEYISNW
jgi:hypothetical protein